MLACSMFILTKFLVIPKGKSLSEKKTTWVKIKRVILPSILFKGFINIIYNVLYICSNNYFKDINNEVRYLKLISKIPYTKFDTREKLFFY